MEKLFRLKKDAVIFFDEKYKSDIYPLDVWNTRKVNINAIEEVERVFIKHGIKTSDCSSTLSGWKDDTTAIHFTIEIRGEEYKFSDDVSKRYRVRELMDKIQAVINNHVEGNTENKICKIENCGCQVEPGTSFCFLHPLGHL